MKAFEHGDSVQTTYGNGTFVQYSNGGQSYKIAFTDGDNAGTEFSLGEKAILSEGSVPESSPNAVVAARSRYEALLTSGLPEFVIHGDFIGLDYDPERNPEAHQRLRDYIGRLEERPIVECHAPPNKIEKAIKELVEVTGLGASDVQSFIHVGSARKLAHDVKYNLFLPNHATLVGLDEELRTNFDHRKQTASGVPDISKFQINKKSLILILVKEGIVELKDYQETK
jgi:hypothetical protein